MVVVLMSRQPCSACSAHCSAWLDARFQSVKIQRQSASASCSQIAFPPSSLSVLQPGTIHDRWISSCADLAGTASPMHTRPSHGDTGCPAPGTMAGCANERKQQSAPLEAETEAWLTSSHRALLLRRHGLVALEILSYACRMGSRLGMETLVHRLEQILWAMGLVCSGT